MFHPWGFWFDLSIGSKHFSFHISIFLLLGLPSAHPVNKTAQHENWKCFSLIEKSHWSPPGMKNTISSWVLLLKGKQTSLIVRRKIQKISGSNGKDIILIYLSYSGEFPLQLRIKFRHISLNSMNLEFNPTIESINIHISGLKMEKKCKK